MIVERARARRRGSSPRGALATATSPRLAAALALALALASLAVAGCGDERRPTRPARTEPGGGQAPIDAPRPGGGDAGGGAAADPDGDPAGAGGAPGEDDDRAAADDAVALGAIPVWQAVVDRAQYLARRGQRAIVAGRLGGEAIAPGARGQVRWLVDEHEGNGALAIRVAIPGRPPAEGARIAVTGAWALDDQRRWYWQVEALSPLTGPAPAAPPDPPAPPGLQLQAGPPPAGHRPISKARDGGVVTFGVIKAPRGDGDGWLVGDDSFSPPIAYLFLPGERASYGGHDLRQADERWSLRRGVTYRVRIDKVRRRSPTDLARIKATTAPVRP